MLKNLRILVATLCFGGLSLLFMDVSGSLPPHLAFLAKVQLVPALLAGSFAVVAGLLVLSLCMGRVYCSTLCPLGVMQDIISRARGKRRFAYRTGHTALRGGMVALFVAALVFGLPLVFGLLEPYSIFGRIAADVLAPLWTVGNNAIAAVAERADSVAVAAAPLRQKGWAALAGAGLMLGVLGVLAWRRGRLWCNTLCPVGAALGAVGRYAWIRPRIDAARCTRCGLCASRCKAECIDAEQAAVDASRCVGCFNCMNVCRQSALAFTPIRTTNATGTTGATMGDTAGTPETTGSARQSPDVARRALLASLVTGFGGMVGGAATAQAALKDLSAPIPALTRRESPAREAPITPPGSASLSRFTALCTGCQLCVAACPNQVLRSFDKGQGMLQPTLSFEHGYCRVNCVSCASVCPTGAIAPITAAVKSATQIGRAYVTPARCVVNTDKLNCTACMRSCPPGAISLAGEGELKMPVVDNERCTGCGACEYVCPARPQAAIYVEGNSAHRRI